MKKIFVPLAFVAAMPLMAQNATLEANINRLFQTAQSHNVSLEACRAATRQAALVVSEAKAARMPDISADVAVSYLGNGRTWNRSFGDAHKASMPHFGNNLALRASQIVYAGGAIDAGITLAEQAKKLAELSEQENLQRVRFMLVSLYLQLHNISNGQHIYDANAVLADTVIAMMRRRQEQGMLLQNDITRYELRLEELRLGSTRMADQLRIARHELLTALGTDEAEIQMLGESAFADCSLPLGSEAEWQALALQNHIGLKKSNTGIAMHRTEEQLARAARRPNICLFAEDYLNGPILIEVPVIDRNFNYWQVGVGVSYNFSSLYKAKRSIRKAEAATTHATETHKVALEGVDNAIHRAYVECMTAQAEVCTQQKRVELANQNYNVVSHRYANDLALITDLTDAANTKLDAELALVNARINLIFNYYKLKFEASNI